MRSDELFSEPTATELEEMRAQIRKKRRIIYDCFNAHIRGDDRVFCAHFRRLRGNIQSADISLLSVLKGASPKVCKECSDYDDKDK